MNIYGETFVEKGGDISSRISDGIEIAALGAMVLSSVAVSLAYDKATNLAQSIDTRLYGEKSAQAIQKNVVIPQQARRS